jgi:HNH endonuclease
VRRRLLAIGVTPRAEALSQMPLEEMRRLYESGIPASDVAVRAGLSLQTVQRRLERAGVHIRGYGEKTELTRARIGAARRLHIPEDRLRELHAQGMSCREMAPILECQEETVRRRLIAIALERLPGKARPDQNAFWRGGYAVDESGYILKHEPGHPQATESGYVRMHRLVMEKHLGRLLLPGEVVDHRNGDTSDNDPGNLQVFPSNAEHLRATLTGRRKLPAAERERLRQEAVRRARQRVAAILAASGNDAGQ